MWGQIRPVGDLLEKWRCSRLTESFLCTLETISGSVDSVGLSWHTHKTKSCPLCVEPTFSTGENWVTQQLHNHHIKYNPPLRLFLFSCQRWRQGTWSPVQDRLLVLKSILLVTSMTNDRVWYLKNKSEPRLSYTEEFYSSLLIIITLLLLLLLCFAFTAVWTPTFLSTFFRCTDYTDDVILPPVSPHWTPWSFTRAVLAKIDNNSTVPELTSL